MPENNRQLRDLLQRQQMITTNMPSTQSQLPSKPTVPITRWNQDGGEEQQPPAHQQHQQVNTADTNTFRQPLPPGISRPPRNALCTGTLVRSTQITQRGNIMNNDIRQRFIRPPIINNLITNVSPISLHQPHVMLNQQPQELYETNDAKMNSISENGNSMLTQQKQPQVTSELIATSTLTQRLLPLSQIQSNISLQQTEAMSPSTMNNGSQLQTSSSDVESQEIPDNVTAELEKLEDENSVMGEVEGVGDILGDLGEDDDDELFNSLTAEIGADFNILEYADPELDTLNDGEKANLLDSLDFGEAEPDKGHVKKEPTDGVSPPKICNQSSEKTNLQELQNSQDINSQKQKFQNIQGQTESEQNETQFNRHTQHTVIASIPIEQQQTASNTNSQINQIKALQHNQISPSKLQHIEQQMLHQVFI